MSDERRREQRQKPPERPMQVLVRLLTPQSSGATADDPDATEMRADVLETSPSGMRLATFVGQEVKVGMEIRIHLIEGDEAVSSRKAQVIWVEDHPMIHTFGVRFVAD